MTPGVIAVVGATAMGKSDLALDVAQRFGASQAEIISADAFQLYRGMDIGTAKTPLADRRGISHHQIDVLDIAEEASVAAYQRSARADVEAVGGRGGQPVVCGGSGLYVRALLDDLEFPGTDRQVREEIARWGDQHGAAALHTRLADVDPVSAARINPANVRRVIRALEVYELTGRPFSASLPSYTYVLDAYQIGVRREDVALRERIGERARAMVKAGFLDEVRDLADRGLAHTPTAVRATGYREALDVLEGRLSPDELADTIAAQTWRLARRQMTWFRRDPRIVWVDPTDPTAASEAIARAVEWAQASSE